MLHVGDPVLDKRSFIMSREQHILHNLSDTIMSSKEKRKGVGEISLGFPWSGKTQIRKSQLVMPHSLNCPKGLLGSAKTPSRIVSFLVRNTTALRNRGTADWKRERQGTYDPKGQVGCLKKWRIIHLPKLRRLSGSTKALGEGLKFKSQSAKEQRNNKPCLQRQLALQWEAAGHWCGLCHSDFCWDPLSSHNICVSAVQVNSLPR